MWNLARSGRFFNDSKLKIYSWQVFYLIMYVFHINHLCCSNIPHMLKIKKTRLKQWFIVLAFKPNPSVPRTFFCYFQYYQRSERRLTRIMYSSDINLKIIKNKSIWEVLHTYLLKAFIDTLFNYFRVCMVDLCESKKLSFYKNLSIISDLSDLYRYNTNIVSFSDTDTSVVPSHKALWKLELFSFWRTFKAKSLAI